METAWLNPTDAYRFAFGLEAGPLAETVVLLHKDRLDDIASLVEPTRWFGGRWRGFVTHRPPASIAFIPVPAGASDACDCILHLAAFAPRRLLFTGTCGGLKPELQIGQVCVATDAWYMGDLLRGLSAPFAAIAGASYLSIPNPESARIIDEFRRTLEIEAQTVRCFTIPVQSIESPSILQAIRRLGADVIDMETAVCLAAARQVGLSCTALLWCTDRPGEQSFYTMQTQATSPLRQTAWEAWPRLILRASEAMSRPRKQRA